MPRRLSGGWWGVTTRWWWLGGTGGDLFLAFLSFFLNINLSWRWGHLDWGLDCSCCGMWALTGDMCPRYCCHWFQQPCSFFRILPRKAACQVMLLLSFLHSYLQQVDFVNSGLAYANNWHHRTTAFAGSGPEDSIPPFQTKTWLWLLFSCCLFWFDYSVRCRTQGWQAAEETAASFQLNNMDSNKDICVFAELFWKRFLLKVSFPRIPYTTGLSSWKPFQDSCISQI